LVLQVWCCVVKHGLVTLVVIMILKDTATLVADGRVGGRCRTLLQPAHAQCLRFFHLLTDLPTDLLDVMQYNIVHS